MAFGMGAGAVRFLLSAHLESSFVCVRRNRLIICD